MAGLDTKALDTLYKETVPMLKVMKGNLHHRPMYPNFPEQVMEMSGVELYWKAIEHYSSNVVPEYAVDVRTPLNEEVKLQELKVCKESDVENFVNKIAKSKVAVSPDNKEILRFFIKTRTLDTDEITNRENAAFIGAEMLKAGKELLPKPTTAVDVLRVAAGYNDNEVSLAEKPKFGKFPRSIRRKLLSSLESCKNIKEDMARHTGYWKRLGECLHPGEFNFENVKKAFKSLRNEGIQTFNAKVETALVKGKGVSELLSSRPGDFARRLDHVLRVEGKTALKEFIDVAERVPLNTLLSMRTHFINRVESNERHVFPKGSTAKMQTVASLEPMDKALSKKVVACLNDAMLKQLSNGEAMGKVYIDPKLKNYPVPIALRSASKALKTLPRGSKIDLEDKDTLRMFCWWKNGNNRVDIDLSAQILREDYSPEAEICYYNLKEFGGVHSGDIVDAPNGASEFIDISLEKVRARGGRYIAMCLKSYTTQPFKDLPECFAGWMFRKSPGSGEIYEPKTVANKVDLAGDTGFGISMLVDAVEKKIIWCDMSLKSQPDFANNLANNRKSLGQVCKALIELKRPTIYELLELHALARGKMVTTPEKADVVFKEEFAYEIEEITANWMAAKENKEILKSDIVTTPKKAKTIGI